MEAIEKQLRFYLTASGGSPFERWFLKLRDKTAKEKILIRLARLRLGNFGDCKSLGQGIYELRICHGPGYRIYFGLGSEQIVLLLLGGDKNTQQRDVYSSQYEFLLKTVCLF